MADSKHPQGSWRDHGDGGYIEPSRGRWDDDRRYTRSRQDQSSDDLHGFGGSYGRGAGRYAEIDRIGPGSGQEVANHPRVSRADQDRASGRESSAHTSTSGNKPKSGSRLP